LRISCFVLIDAPAVALLIVKLIGYKLTVQYFLDNYFCEQFQEW